jgi:hypothetical protein
MKLQTLSVLVLTSTLALPPLACAQDYPAADGPPPADSSVANEAPPPAAGATVTADVAPPALQSEVQPPPPDDGDLWQPGYWAYGPLGYAWVPGLWVLPPAIGLLWTPGFWAFGLGHYFWHAGYWGSRVGYYGGINYGFGYFGLGFWGGYWRGGHFFYNAAVCNLGRGQFPYVYHHPYAGRGFEHGARASFAGGGRPSGFATAHAPSRYADRPSWAGHGASPRASISRPAGFDRGFRNDLRAGVMPSHFAANGRPAYGNYRSGAPRYGGSFGAGRAPQHFAPASRGAGRAGVARGGRESHGSHRR